MKSTRLFCETREEIFLQSPAKRLLFSSHFVALFISVGLVLVNYFPSLYIYPFPSCSFFCSSPCINILVDFPEVGSPSRCFGENTRDLFEKENK